MAGIPAHKMQKQKDQEFKSSLGCIVSPMPAWVKV